MIGVHGVAVADVGPRQVRTGRIVRSRTVEEDVSPITGVGGGGRPWEGVRRRDQHWRSRRTVRSQDASDNDVDPLRRITWAGRRTGASIAGGVDIDLGPWLDCDRRTGRNGEIAGDLVAVGAGARRPYFRAPRGAR